MYSAGSMPVERPAGWRNHSSHQSSQSARNSPTVSRQSSVSSIASTRTDPGVQSQHGRNASTTSVKSTSSSKSTLRSLFGRGEKKSKEKKDTDKVVLTSRHAAAVKSRMATDPRYKGRPPVKTAGITSSIRTAHLSAAEQEARHPHSGPPAMHSNMEMPSLTRIISGDERDEEDELDRLERARLEWNITKLSSFTRIREHHHIDSVPTSAEQSEDEDQFSTGSREGALSPAIEGAISGTELQRPALVTKNSHGGRFHKDSYGRWTR